PKRRSILRRRVGSGPSAGKIRNADARSESLSKEHPTFPRNGSRIHGGDDRAWTQADGGHRAQPRPGRVVFHPALHERSADPVPYLQLSARLGGSLRTAKMGSWRAY